MIPVENRWTESSCERFFISCSRGPAGPEIPQLLILAGPVSLPAAQEAVTFFMASPHVDPAACYWEYYGLAAPTLCLAVREEPLFSGDFFPVRETRDI